jgi:hypothetical protein
VRPSCPSLVAFDADEHDGAQFRFGKVVRVDGIARFRELQRLRQFAVD